MLVCPAYAQAQSLPTDVVINEVFYLGNSNEDWVEMKNTGTDTVNISAWWFCSRFTYRPFSTQTILFGDDLMLEPGEIIVLSVGIDLNGTAGADLGLYVTNVFSDADNMADFVQWTTANRVGRSNEAIQRTFWVGDTPSGPVDFIDTASPAESTAYCGTNGGGNLMTLSSDFVNAVPTMGMENDSSCFEELLYLNGFEEDM